MGNADKKQTTPSETKPQWVRNLRKYSKADVTKSYTQLLLTIVPYLALMWGNLWLIQQEYPYWMVLIVSVVACPFLVRIFIIFHDCTHHSFLPTKRGCTLVGRITGLFVLTSYANWKKSHLTHHATFGNLDQRGIGDITTMTVREYEAASKFKKLGYRVLRNPLFLLLVIPLLYFVAQQRLPLKGAGAREKRGVLELNMVIIGVLLTASLTIGVGTLLMVFLPVIYLASAVGIWLFFVQHQFEEVYWARNEAFDRMRSVMEGCSYYQLPAILRWASGNIGYHHLHHLAARIPNYKLKACFDETPELQEITPMTLRESLKCILLSLWDEDRKRLITFADLRKTSG